MVVCCTKHSSLAQVDVFAFAMIAYFVTAGKPPYKKETTPVKVLTKLQQGMFIARALELVWM